MNDATALIEEGIKNTNNDEKRKKYRKWLADMAENPDSIFLTYFGGRKSAGLVDKLRDLDKVINNLKINSVFVFPIEEVKKSLSELNKLNNEIWDIVKRYVPNLYSFDPKKWRTLNDSISEKRIMAQRWSILCIVPKNEEIAQIAMAMKIIHKSSREYQQSDFDEYEKLIRDYVTIHDKISQLKKDINEKIDNYLKKINKSPSISS